VQVSARPYPVAGAAADRYLRPGLGPDLGPQERLVPLHDRDVIGFLSLTSQFQVRPHGAEGVLCALDGLSRLVRGPGWSWPPGPDSTTHAPTRHNATPGKPVR
jgi:hypothetical protein